MITKRGLSPSSVGALGGGDHGRGPLVNAEGHPSFQVKLMKNRSPQQLELFADGVCAVAGARRPKPDPLTEQRLQAKLAGARLRLREIVILGMTTWLPDEARQELAKVEGHAREQVRVHHRMMDRVRAEQRGISLC